MVKRSNPNEGQRTQKQQELGKINQKTYQDTNRDLLIG